MGKLLLLVLLCHVSFSKQSGSCPDLATLGAQAEKKELYDAIEEAECITDELKGFYENPCREKMLPDLDDYEECPDPPLEFDYVIVGGGRSGCVLANRLSEVPNWDVAILERGYGISPVSRIPVLKPYVRFTNYSKYLCMEQQENFGKALQVMPIFEGAAFGGSSTINPNIYNGGLPDDFSDVECFDSIQEYTQKSEKARLSSGALDPAYHRFDGLLSQSHAPVSDLGQAFINCGLEQGYGEIDPAGNFGEGFYKARSNSEGGRRMNHYDAFLKPVLWRKNLSPIGSAYVFKILFDGNEAIGVKYLKDNMIYTVLARKEVVVALSAYDAAKLLMVSGIGPREHLKKFKIPCIKNLPVGYNLFGKIFYAGLAFETNCTSTPSCMKDVINKDTVEQFLSDGSGPLASPYNLEAIGNIAINCPQPNVEFRLRNAFFTTDKGEVDIKSFGLCPEFYKKHFKRLEGHRVFSIFPILKTDSLGRVKLCSRNPFADPEVYGNYYTKPSDRKNLIEAIKFILEFMKCESFEKFNIRFYDRKVPACEHHKGDDYWNCAIEYLAFPSRDFGGTCKMGQGNDTSAVTDMDGKVLGVQKVRVTGRTILPSNIFGGSNAVSTLVAERTADSIKKDVGVVKPKFCTEAT